MANISENISYMVIFSPHLNKYMLLYQIEIQNSKHHALNSVAMGSLYFLTQLDLFIS